MMTFRYEIVFGLLVIELLSFLLLMILPHKWFYWCVNIAKGTKIHSLAKGFKWATAFAFLLVILLFVESITGILDAESKLEAGRNFLIPEAEFKLQAKEFYNERNFYMCSFTLFTSLVLNRYFTLLLTHIESKQLLEKKNRNSFKFE